MRGGLPYRRPSLRGPNFGLCRARGGTGCLRCEFLLFPRRLHQRFRQYLPTNHSSLRARQHSQRLSPIP